MWQVLRVFVAVLTINGIIFCCGFVSVASDPAASDKALLDAICPVVYSLDESSSDRGYHYIFYGNAFFIDKDGYLLTAAHVLTDFQNGGQPQVLLRLPEAPPRLVKVRVVALDSQHDVAILQAVPNPFNGRYEVSFLPLSSTNPVRGSAILAAALRPTRLKDPHTFDAPQQDKSLAEVLQYASISLNKGQPEADLFLFNHEVIRGQSGAPIVSRDTQEVVGIVEGQWLHGIPLASAIASGDRGSTMGAGLPISYAVALLEQQHVSWQTASNIPQ